MDILLFNPPVKKVSRHSGLTLPLGLAYIAAVLIESGYSVAVVDFNIGGYNPERVETILRRETPRMVGISTHTETYPNSLRLAGIVKKFDPGTTVVFGGPHATIMHREAAGEKDVDAVVRGEGEYTILELADCLIRNRGSLSEVKGITYKQNGAIRTNPEREFIKAPDELPFPARELFPLSLYAAPGTVLLSRGGCPFNCRFCAVNNVWKSKRRYRQPAKVMQEIIHILKHIQVRSITFADDALTLDKGCVAELCSLLKESLRLKWQCATRVDLVDRELLGKMRDAGCCDIQYGIEAGSDSILESIGKRITQKQIREAVQATIDAGIDVECSFMFPHPDDSEDTIDEQIRLMKELQNRGAILHLSFTTPFPGTYYFDHGDELGIKVLAKSWDEYDAKHLMITTRHLSEDRLRFLLEKLVQEVGLQPSS